MNGKVCFYCTRAFIGHRLLPGELCGEEFIDRTRDHIIPTSRGGINNPKNIVYACSSCNKAKGNLFLEEFLDLLKAGKWSHFGKTRVRVMIANTAALIDQIAPYRSALFKRGFEKADQTIKELVIERLAFRPSSKQQEVSQAQFLWNLQKRFPFVNDLLIAASPDLPRWIYDNLVKVEDVNNRLKQ